MRGWELASGLAVGLLAGLLLRGGGSGDVPSREPARAPAPVSEAQDGKDTVARLREQLAEERSRRVALESRLAVRQGNAPPGDGAPATASEPGKPAPSKDGWPDEAVLREAGISPADLELLRTRLEEIELERLYVRDQATREGWLGRPRFRLRMQELDRRYEALREDLGDDVWDWVLYASGRDNRVVVSRVMQGSVSQDAGIERGDVFLRYDDRRIFDVAGLQRSTTTGQAGETVAVDVLRDGEEYRFYVPRGPLGLGLGPTRSVRPGRPY